MIISIFIKVIKYFLTGNRQSEINSFYYIINLKKKIFFRSVKEQLKCLLVKFDFNTLARYVLYIKFSMCAEQ